MVRLFAGEGGSAHTHCGNGQECNKHPVGAAVMVKNPASVFLIHSGCKHRDDFYNGV